MADYKRAYHFDVVEKPIDIRNSKGKEHLYYEYIITSLHTEPLVKHFALGLRPSKPFKELENIDDEELYKFELISGIKYDENDLSTRDNVPRTYRYVVRKYNIRR
jgi:hypothetical protein